MLHGHTYTALESVMLRAQCHIHVFILQETELRGRFNLGGYDIIYQNKKYTYSCYFACKIAEYKQRNAINVYCKHSLLFHYLL